MMVVVLQVQVQEVYTHMVQQSKVITISGRPGIGKTEVGVTLDWFSGETVAKHWQRCMQKVGRLCPKNDGTLCLPGIVLECNRPLI